MNQIGKKGLVFTVILLFLVVSLAQIQISISPKKLQNEWVAHPMFISPFGGFSTPQGYLPSQIRTAYNLPSSGGNGTTIAVLDAYDTPNILSSFNTFSATFGLPDNSTGNFLVHKMASNIQTDDSWALETCLDVEWAHAIAPNATILLVEAVDNTDISLLNAVDYASNQPGVVAVSMSWGGVEFSNEVSKDYHFNKPGITFFASSGDDGSSVTWPAVSSSVVSVGGTTLSLNPDGTVISEVAWTNSSGGLSSFVSVPSYQASFGLPYSKRAVPDVSYNANASTGVSVYNGSWWRMGGTSAGAPQWAAIHALGQSVTNFNLYNRAKSAYPVYFRDITVGSNYVNSTTQGYDLVTGLGSPLTTNFGADLSVNPTSGPPGASISLNGVGFLGSSANISYFNPVNSSWINITNNLTTTNGNFSYTFNAPDLLQSNQAGDNPSLSDNIIFRAQDGNGQLYNTSVPYTEWRRGLVQIGNSSAKGLYGNNTDFSMSLFVQSGDSLPFTGNWFSPGNISLVWDNTTNLGSVSTDANGFFSGTVQVPIAAAGKHTLNFNDGASNFCLNLTRLPMVTNDYVDGWHTQNFAVNLTPDSSVNETFYRINGGAVLNVTANGQPTITAEGSSNLLEYWSTWNLYGTGTIELPHNFLNGIKLDKTPPIGTITTNQTTSTSTIALLVTATDATSGVAQMRFSNDGSFWSNWEPYGTYKLWTLPIGDGQKTVSVQFMDNAGLTSTSNCSVTLTTPEPTVTPTPAPSPTLTPTPSPAPNPTPSLAPPQTTFPTNNKLTNHPTPETIPLTIVAGGGLFVAVMVCLAVLLVRSRKHA